MNTVSAPIAPPSRNTASRLTAFKYSSNLARLRPASAYLQPRPITASKCISKAARLRPPSSHDHSLQTRTITALECISKFTWSPCGETVELEGRQLIINTPPHLAWHPKGIVEKAQFWLEERGRGWEDMKGYPDMMNHTNCVDLWMLGTSALDQELGKIECVFRIMRWCLSSPGFPKYILPVVHLRMYIYRET